LARENAEIEYFKNKGQYTWQMSKRNILNRIEEGDLDLTELLLKCPAWINYTDQFGSLRAQSPLI